MEKASLWIIVPCYNEEDVLPVTAPLFLNELTELTDCGRISLDSRILFVDDGSGDKTWDIIKRLSSEDGRFMGIQQSRNRGHQNAVLAGLTEAKDKCDITITVDCDGQDDVRAMRAMVEAYNDGCEIVYGVRNDRSSDSFFKLFSAQAYYKLLRRLGAEVIYNHADYRLVSSRVLKEFSEFKEVNLFLRGMFPLVGFKSTCVYYERHKRVAGKSHYSLRKMLNLAFDGITGLSDKPLSLIAAAGAVLLALGTAGLIAVFALFLSGKSDLNTALIIGVVAALCGVQLICTGVLGKYIGKIYMEVKRRPRFIISDRTENMPTSGGSEKASERN